MTRAPGCALTRAVPRYDKTKARGTRDDGLQLMQQVTRAFIGADRRRSREWAVSGPRKDEVEKWTADV
ncbi:hypothetical protein NDU88_010131 [Pleurodeles waltl]|uniref:Uncharacterized protein n=1 Tax=Pleurodeles waltl TaxID=8319 RepID=A0AAV7PUA8_PLEWA|nr:hypothetical protein NDU88_010131 [Pleurodeles waltl]